MFLNKNINYLLSKSADKLQIISNKLGIKSSLLSNIKNGRSFPSYEVLLKFSEIFNVSIDDLIKKDIEIEGIKSQSGPTKPEDQLKIDEYLQKQVQYLEQINDLQQKVIMLQEEKMPYNTKKTNSA
jgi:transcriptional regulator with XRE-family HTH domain